MSFSPITRTHTETAHRPPHHARPTRPTRNYSLIAPAVILLLIILSAGAFAAPPLYTATSQIAVESAPTMRPFLSPTGELYTPGMLNETDLNTHMAEIISDRVLQKVIEGGITRIVWRCDQCGREYSRDQILETHTVKCTRQGCSGHITRYEEPLFPDWIDLRTKWAKDDKRDEPYPIDQALAILRRRVKVAPERGTRLINIAYTSPDKNEVADVANMIANVYAQYQEKEVKKRIDDALTTLLEESDRLARGSGSHKGLLELEEDLATYKHANKLLIETGVTDTFDFSEFKSRKINLEMRITGLEQRLHNLQKLSREQQIAALQGNQSLSDYKRMLAEQKIILNQRLVQFGPDHQEVKRTEQSIKDLEKQIDIEIKGILNSMRLDLQALQSEKNALQKAMANIEQELFHMEQLLTEYRRRAKEVQRLERIYDQLIRKATTELIVTVIPGSRIRITREARTPMHPSKPGTDDKDTSSRAPEHTRPATTPKHLNRRGNCAVSL